MSLLRKLALLWALLPQPGQPKHPVVAVGDVSQVLVDRLYFATCAEVARELNPSKPKVLTPAITIVLDPEAVVEGIEGQNGTYFIRLRKWSDERFAEGVAAAALWSAIKSSDRQVLAKRAVRLVHVTVDVQELKAK